MRLPRAFLVGGALFVVLGLCGSVEAEFYPIVDLTQLYGEAGVQWVIHNPITGNVLAGTGFKKPLESIYDGITGQWLRVGQADVGEALYVALPPRELQPFLPAQYARRVYLATENKGMFGYYDPAGPGLQLPWNAGPPNKCGTSIGYWPATGSVYFGFVWCPGQPSPNKNTRIYRHFIDTAPFHASTYNKSINGGWVLIPDGPVPHLYNTAHDPVTGLIHIVRMDDQNICCTELAAFSVGAGGAHWSHADYNGGFYYSEFADKNSGQHLYAYRVAAGPTRTPIAKGQSMTFLTDYLRSQLFTFLAPLPKVSG